MNKRLLLVPVDARPVTRDLPCQIAMSAGWEVLVPPKEWLGFLKRPGKIETIHSWVKKHASRVDGFVLSMDMLNYGGLVPSRINKEPLEAIVQRVQLLNDLKEAFPDKPILAFSATMRISNTYVNEEEKEYWSEYGKELWSYSYYSHKLIKTGDEEAKVLTSTLKNKIPQTILDDWLSTRRRNAEVNVTLLNEVENDVLDTLIFPQDDTAKYGFNIQEQENLHEMVLKRHLFEKVLIYPGADEVACTLLTKLILKLEQVDGFSFYPFYSGELGALSPALYEDRPLIESVKGQIYAIGGFVTEASEADIILAVNVPGRKQGEIALQQSLDEVNTPDRNVGEWLRRVQFYLRKGKPVAIADLAYANGGDPAMVIPLTHTPGLSVAHLSAYAGWNTAGNTLGTVVSQAAVDHLNRIKGLDNSSSSEKKRLEQLIHRLLEDYVYQSSVRQMVRHEVDEGILPADHLLDRVKETFLKEAKLFLNQPGFHYLNERWQIDLLNVHLPWNRTFEIGFDVNLRERTDWK